ncbi:MAG: alpha/beta hydrolase [Alphaproteobacteria bacterium]|nr:alpha/beta hydrolase [Alphaproteobacteria bacterium]MBV9694091.1 alpha/beta hydrolase [Alphaproteobacteria bacterium]
MNPAWLRFLRSAAVLLAAGCGVVYVALFVVLTVYQRDLLFIRGRHERARDPLYRAAQIRETDGTRLTLWESTSAAGAPIVIFFYGNAGTLSDFEDLGERLHARGFGIVLASYRGYSGNSGAPSEEGLMRDARATLQSLPPRHGPLVLWGQSLGSGVAARMAAEAHADALILQSPYTAVVDVAAERFPFYPVRLVMRDRFDTLSLVPKIQVPVLILHGTDDAVVPFAMGQLLAQRFSHAALVAIAHGGHDLGEGQILPPAEAWLMRLGLGSRPNTASGSL